MPLRVISISSGVTAVLDILCKGIVYDIHLSSVKTDESRTSCTTLKDVVCQTLHSHLDKCAHFTWHANIEIGCTAIQAGTLRSFSVHPFSCQSDEQRNVLSQRMNALAQNKYSRVDIPSHKCS